MQVGFHVFKYQIDVSVIFCLQDIQQSEKGWFTITETNEI